jgi:serine/threonine-protein kinase
MDYVPGEDLRTIMLKAKQKNQFLPEIDVMSWISQLCDALIFLHDQETPILHRDIKPSNLKLTPSGLLKLVDFGLVKIAAPGEVTITIVQGQGTALYTPLEQYGGDQGHTDVRSDIFSMGSTMYHLLTNTPPTDARQRFLNPESLKPPRSINPEISSRTEKCMLWAMNLHPDERPEDVSVFRQTLFGDRSIPLRPMNKKITFQEIIRMNPEQTLLYSAILIFILSFLLTVGK